MSEIWAFILPLTGIILGWLIRFVYARIQVSSAEQKAKRIVQDAVKESEAKRRELLLETKDQLIRERSQLEQETRERRGEIQRLERRLLQKEENLEKRAGSLEKQERTLQGRERLCTEREEKVIQDQEKCKKELEHLSGLTAAEAKKLLIQSLENEAKHDAQILINRIEQEAQLSAEKRARERGHHPGQDAGGDRRRGGAEASLRVRRQI